jgi:hypothetical protein
MEGNDMGGCAQIASWGDRARSNYKGGEIEHAGRRWGVSLFMLAQIKRRNPDAVANYPPLHRVRHSLDATLPAVRPPMSKKSFSVIPSPPPCRGPRIAGRPDADAPTLQKPGFPKNNPRKFNQ